MGIDNPAPTVARDSTAIDSRPTGSVKRVSDDFPVLHLSMARFSLTEFAQRSPDPEEKFTFAVMAIALAIVLAKVVWE